MATINSGITMRLLPLTQYNFSNQVLSSTITVPVAMHIEAGMFTEVDLAVRLHNGTIMNANQVFKVSVAADGYDFADPASQFFGPTLASVMQTGVPTLPFYNMVTLSGGTGTTPWARYLGVFLSFTQPNPATQFVVNVSIDLTLKGGDPTAMPMSPNSYRGYRIL